MLRKLVTMRDALDDPAYFGEVFRARRWAAWRALLIACLGEELTDAERELFQAVTGREREPLEPVAEFWGVIGRGRQDPLHGRPGGLPRRLRRPSHVLGPGERGMLPLLAARQRKPSRPSASSGAYSAARRLCPSL